MAAPSDRANLLLTFCGRKGYAYKPLAASPRAGRIVAVDADPDAPVRAWAQDFAVVPPVSDSEGYLTALERLCREHSIDAILPLNDLDVRLLSSERERFSRAGTVVLGCPADVTAALCDKLAAAVWLRTRGFPTPPTWLAGDFKRNPDRLRWPVVTKARFGQGSQGFRVLRSTDELEGVPDEAVVQQYLDGRHYDLDILRAADGTVTAVVAKEKIEMVAGTASMARSVLDEQLVALGIRLADALALVGVVDADVIVSGEVAYVLEVNPRLGGCFPFTCIYCPEFPTALLEIAKGRTPRSLLRRYRDGVLVSREWSFVEIPSSL